MSKFNTSAARPAVFSPVASESTPSGTTHEGGAGYARDTKSELFLLSVANMVGENTFYEASGKRDDRYATLVRNATLEDPEWTARFLRWLRSDANMRSASIVGAAEFTQARLGAALPGMSRQVIASVLQRADEPGEFMAYWISTYGRTLSMPVKRGLADAALRLYTERAYLKWDSEARGVRFADVIEMVRPKPAQEWQSDLFRYALDVRHGNADTIPDSLRVLRRRDELMKFPVDQRRSFLDHPVYNFAGAAMTWESLAGWLQGPMDAKAWEAVIPSMGYMALLRNLRNFDQAGVSDKTAAQVAARLADPEQVTKSHQFPMRFLSAYRAAPSLRWAWPLEKAIDLSLSNVPELSGRTLILVDTSGSMGAPFSKDGTLMRWDAAAVFGIALGKRCATADVVSFSNGYYGGNGTKVFPLESGQSLLKAVDRWKDGGYFIGGGTDTAGAIQRHLRPGYHDRLVILTDEQASYGDVGSVVPAPIPLYTWNLAGYEHGHASSGIRNRHTFGGLTDQAFRMIPLLEAGTNCDWPF